MPIDPVGAWEGGQLPMITIPGHPPATAALSQGHAPESWRLCSQLLGTGLGMLAWALQLQHKSAGSKGEGHPRVSCCSHGLPSSLPAHTLPRDSLMLLCPHSKKHPHNSCRPRACDGHGKVGQLLARASVPGDLSGLRGQAPGHRTETKWAP